MKSIIVVFFVILCVNTSWCADYYEDIIKEISRKEFRDSLTEKALNVWNWVKQQSKTENTFIGRCFGIGKKLRVLIPLMIFALGVILTTLKFLTIFSLKGLGIGVLLLIMNVAGWVGKLATWKTQFEHQGPNHHQPQTIHFHIHKDKGQYTVGHSGSGDGWYDRISDGLSKTNSVAEKIELLNMYKRLGFNVDQSVLSQYR